MLEKFKGKVVNIQYYMAIGSGTAGGNNQILKKVTLSDYDNDFIVFNDSICINRKHVVKIELA